MILRIDQHAPEPVYLQLHDQIIAAIAHGELRPADRLPSVRALASDLGINLHTVNKTYALLRDEGYLLMHGRAGAVVADYRQAASAARKAEDATKLAASLRQLALEHCAQGGTEASFLEEARKQAAQVYAEKLAPDEMREIRVLGLDQDDERLARDAARRRSAHDPAASTRAHGPAPKGA